VGVYSPELLMLMAESLQARSHAFEGVLH
jgi:hypothetical protein